MTAGNEIENGRASSLTDIASSRSSWAINARLVGSASAANVRSSGAA
jgi:hypothetical protein